MDLEPCEAADVEALRVFLADMDLTTNGLDAAGVRLWIERDARGAVVGSTGYELSADGRHALVRSVAVAPAGRSRGRGGALARYAMDRAASEGARTAWLFSRRSGPFWQGRGFRPADRDELARVLPDALQVRAFRESGQLQREVAWARELGAVSASVAD